MTDQESESRNEPVERNDLNKDDTIKCNDNKVLDEQYWKACYEQLKVDFDRVQKLNQNLEEKLLNVVETFEKKKEELVASIEYEKSTLIADVDKLSTKLVDARIKLHDYEEKEMIRAGKNSSYQKDYQVNEHIVRTNLNSSGFHKISSADRAQMMNDPNLV